ncbi:MAG: SusD/RagB family nutrient-binding outer membrane lipoprotein [Bacteroidales bacterium]|nr:SusD/RagB family nutrient-binding outer membrane lipoprotein [Bacteroidales bacterium]
MPFLVLAGIALIGTSCTKNFEEINTNPNNPDTAPLESVLAYNIIEITDRFDINTEMEYAASYVGHVTMSQNNDIQNYITQSPSGMWSQYYIRNLSNLNGIINDATDENVNIKGAALVLKAYATMIQVDAYGAVPYFEAAKLDEGIEKPVFDSEEVIYDDLFKILKEANDLFDDQAKDLGSGDLIYGGKNTTMRALAWKKFANSLRLRLAIRISIVNEEKAKKEINEILGDATKYPIFENNDDGAIVVFPGIDWVEPWTDRAGYKPYIRIAAPIVDTLKKFNDPRLAEYAAPLRNGSYKGLQVGADGKTVFGKPKESPVNDQFIKNTEDGKVFFMTYSEVEFIKAEAYSRGLYGSAADAETAYNNAITANMDMYGISSSDITTYLAQTDVKWNGDVHKVYIQKWISLFRQSWEAWAEMRRTDVPLLPLAAQANYTNHNRVPYRFAYPDSEKNLNGDNIPSDVVEDDFYWGTQIWWDTRNGVN